MAVIYTVTLNPAIDHTMRFPTLAPGRLNRARNSRVAGTATAMEKGTVMPPFARVKGVRDQVEVISLQGLVA